ncbi:enoyl-CoA hydratase-related protein [Nocardia asiatica]|uniref:enoyl-CoA hydratase-related protein n=1 Tax=Nocardia asiatica TaxID=209252 RepID=UPI0002E9885D|nr:enoyl-CoA hydratase-related protein [Nocardia asiatica]
MTTSAETIRVHTRDGVGWIAICNPAKKNALSTAMMSQLAEILDELDRDNSVAVMVLHGEGSDAFIAGADIGEFELQQTIADARAESDLAIASLFDTCRLITTPLIAMVDGYCIGAGVAVALHADIRIATARATFAIPAARLGLGYPVDQVFMLVHAVGPGMASEILFSARKLDAAEALSAGLVNRVVESDDLAETVGELARTVAANAPLTVRAAKAAIRAAVLGTDVSRAEADVRTAQCGSSEDVREGQRAFMQKRRPTFTGR